MLCVWFCDGLGIHGFPLFNFKCHSSFRLSSVLVYSLLKALKTVKGNEDTSALCLYYHWYACVAVYVRMYVCMLVYS